MDEDRYKLRVAVNIYDGTERQSLSVEETFSINAKNFMEICIIVSRFHELAEVLKHREELNDK